MLNFDDKELLYSILKFPLFENFKIEKILLLHSIKMIYLNLEVRSL